MPFAIAYFIDRDMNQAWHAVPVEMEVAQDGLEFLGVELFQHRFSGNATGLGCRLYNLNEHFAGGIRHGAERLVRVVEFCVGVGLFERESPSVRIACEWQAPEAGQCALCRL